MTESIVQADKERCFICGQYPCGDSLDCHHVYFGKNRKKSEKYGLTVYLHHNKCHIFGKMSVHGNAQVNRRLQAHVQKIAMRHYNWTEDEFRKEFGKSYI